MEDELTALQARICKVLSHPKRLQIIYALRTGERSVGELAQELKLSYANLSQHLRMLLEARLVEVRHQGRFSYYRLSTPQIAEACDLVRRALRERLTQLGELAHANNQKSERERR
uniref:ArsR family transcriptional regulator n=1 Tax=Acetithermum autotrophicum TaxID=1446466 RepID=H5STY6_ACEAU|nr:ArsR family transcriptional regulator [Candidatus Acetothermum autotrophicum]